MSEEKPKLTVNIEEIDDHPIFRRKLLDKLNSPEQLDTLITITSPRSWLIVLALGILVVATFVWGFAATIETTVEGHGVLVDNGQADNVEVVVYTSMRDARRIHQGSEIKISPLSFRPEEYGLLVGIVQSVRHEPSTVAEMAAVLGNDALAQATAGDGYIIEVRATLISADTPSGYLWTSVDGPPAALNIGTPANADIIVSKVRPYQLVFSQ